MDARYSRLLSQLGMLLAGVSLSLLIPVFLDLSTLSLGDQGMAEMFFDVLPWLVILLAAFVFAGMVILGVQLLLNN